MGWPKGVPRKGYIKKDGTPHKNQGSDYVPAPYVADPTGSSDYEPPKLHGVVGTGPISSPCPKCMYAYADGGYCNDCGWTKPLTIEPYGTHVGRRF